MVFWEAAEAPNSQHLDSTSGWEDEGPGGPQALAEGVRCGRTGAPFQEGRVGTRRREELQGLRGQAGGVCTDSSPLVQELRD